MICLIHRRGGKKSPFRFVRGLKPRTLRKGLFLFDSVNRIFVCRAAAWIILPRIACRLFRLFQIDNREIKVFDHLADRFRFHRTAIRH